MNYKSHFCCWEQDGAPACGIPLEKHTQCCLCEATPKTECCERCSDQNEYGKSPVPCEDCPCHSPKTEQNISRLVEEIIEIVREHIASVGAHGGTFGNGHPEARIKINAAVTSLLDTMIAEIEAGKRDRFDQSDQSKWGIEYKRLDDHQTNAFNAAKDEDITIITKYRE